MKMKSDEDWMRLALIQARKAGEVGEVPVGAVLVRHNEQISYGHNSPIQSHDPTAHAEIVALRNAGHTLNNYRLPGSILYVTIEPCMMCAGALVHARVQKVVYGAPEPKGGVGHSHPLLHSDWLNHRVEVVSGVLAADCAQLLTDFFVRRREQMQAGKLQPGAGVIPH